MAKQFSELISGTLLPKIPEEFYTEFSRKNVHVIFSAMFLFKQLLRNVLEFRNMDPEIFG